MGCGSSKGVAPAPAPAAAVSSLKDQQGSAPASDAAALHKQRLEQQHSQNTNAQHQQQQANLCLPGRIESTTAPAPPPLLKELPEVVDLPPLRKDPTKTAADAEFDYGKELQRGEALGSAGGAPPDKSAQGAVVGGLLSKQPDWLRGSSSDPSTGAGKLPGLTPAQGPPAGKAVSSLPPLVGRGMGAPAAGGSSLPPLFAGGARALAPMDSQHKGDGAATGDAVGSSARVSGSDGDVAQEAQQASLRKQASSKSSSSSASSSRSGSPAAAAARAPAPAAIAAASSHGPADSADPWNSLQSQYAHAQGSPSPDSSVAGGSPPAAVAPAGRAVANAGASSLPPLHGSAAAAAAGAAGSRRGTGSQQPEPKRELFLVDSDEESPAPKPQQQQQQQQQQKGDSLSVLGAAKTNRSSFSSSGGKISAQSSQHSVSSGVPHVAKSGGWGVGSLAGAGTIMVGDEAPSRKPGLPSTAAGADDDVFGDDETPVLPRGFGANAAGLAAEGSSNLRSSRSRVRVGAAPQETLDVEEIEDDVDAMIESEMARDSLPADLAAKLAQIEAMGAESEDGEASGAESPSIYAMMNDRQGSWRAA